ncbi:MAG: class I SAM-dependent methyltransferase [Ignavibacteriales bacterium]|nr:MAG: class I SAM-dependent methyltransferase [Ignavibacteriales bacterium]
MSRWNLAQDYERNWWEKRSETIDFDFYKSFATELVQYTNAHFSIKDDSKILECGSGAGGILTYLTSSGQRYAFDPLENFYSSIRSFRTQRDSQVKYITARGEEIPFPDKTFDLIIMDNVLDHCESPVKVISEIKRVLGDNGIVYFKQNTYHLWGKLIRKVMEFFLIDKGHPHTFTKKNLDSLFKRYDLSTIKNSRSGYYKTWKREFTSKRTIDKIKAILLVNRDKVTYLLKI